MAFGLVMLITSLAAGVGIWRLDRLQGIANDLGGASSERALLAQELHAIVVLSSSRAETLLQIEDAGFAARINADRRLTSARSERVRKRLEELTDTARTHELFRRIDDAGAGFRTVRDALVQRKDAGQKLTGQEIASQLRPAADAYAKAVDDLAAYQAQRVEEGRADAVRSKREGITMLVTGTALGLSVSLVGAWWLTRSVVAPLATAVATADRVATGDLTQTIRAEGDDEAAQLLNALSRMQTHLATVVSGVRANAVSVATASTQIARGHQDLSQRTEEQASALHQTAATMEQLNATVRNNAENANRVRQLAQGAAEIATRGGELVGQVVTTIDGLRDSSHKIGDIIGMIDGIAYQTNILALNAAVEAARAGAQGQGFAVVAAQVRTLSQRSAEAAGDIKALIGHSVEQVDHGTVIVHRAGETMDEIVRSIGRVSALMGEISLASEEQSAGFSQVGDAVGQMDHMTQHNAVLVEQGAAAAQSLRAQAQALVDRVAIFKLADAGVGETAEASEPDRARKVGQTARKDQPEDGAVPPRNAPSTTRSDTQAGTEKWVSL